MSQALFRLRKVSGKPGKDLVSGATDGDKENRTPTLQESKGAPIDHALTIPQLDRTRDLLQADIGTTSQITPCFMPSSDRRQSRSDPVPKVLRNITNTIGRPKPAFEEDFNGLLSSITDMKHEKVDCSGKVEPCTPAKAKKKVKIEQHWTFTDDNAGCIAILKALKLELDPSPFTCPIDLFRYLESSKGLDSKVLKLFSLCPGIDSLDFSPTYAGHINELGLFEPSVLPARKCTVPIFGGFSEVKVLDFTNVHIVDDDLRFLIRLEKLQALGLSGTKITNKGLKYLATHATFKSSLQCIKLCYNDAVGLAGFEHLAESFKRLKEVDLWGCNQVKLSDCHPFVKWSKLRKLRLPADLHELIEERHLYYQELSRDHPELVLKPSEVASFSDVELRAQLKLHRKFVTDIYFNVPKEALLKRLSAILQDLYIQEQLYPII